MHITTLNLNDIFWHVIHEWYQLNPSINVNGEEFPRGVDLYFVQSDEKKTKSA